MKHKILAAVFILFAALTPFAFAGCTGGDAVVIYSSMEDFRNEKLQQMLKDKFPDVKVRLQYYPSGNNAAKIKAEGKKVAADIVLDIDYGYMQALCASFADLEGISDFSVYDEGLAPENKKFLPHSKLSVGVIVNEKMLGAKPLPADYEALADSVYKDLIVMPSPVASGTGYGFLKGMVALMGEDAAFTYFDRFQKNVKQFSSSGSGPVNSLVRGDAAIGVGMIFQAVQEINKGAGLKILDMAQGAPYSLSGMAIIDGKQGRDNVKEVFNFIAGDFLLYDKVHFMPGKIFKDQPKSEIENFPEVTYMDMKGFDPDEKERLLSKWKY